MKQTANLFVKQRSQTTTLKQPKEITCYSRNREEEYLPKDDCNLHYYYFPDSYLDNNVDLSGGAAKFKDFQKNFKDRCSLKGLLASLQQYEMNKNTKIKADIITFRGIIRKLISAAFDSEQFNHVDLRVLVFDGQIFIKEIPQDEPELVGKAKLNAYSGYKFETLATIPQPLPFVSRELLEKRPKKIVTTGDEYVSVVKTGISNCRLVLGAEVDCIFDFKESSKTNNIYHYAELKCTQQICTAQQARGFDKKIFRTWLQCFLVGIPRIIYGFRDDNMVLKSVEEFSTEEIPILLKDDPAWANACLDAIKWYGALTQWLLDTIPRNDDKKCYKLVFENNHLRLSEFEESDQEYDGIVNGDVIISKEFREWRTQLKSQKDK
ncbi:hypothetical protein TBLA_0E00180 [Henningerozyma blattae CBS 6284]|uniref:Decapping nuclease n=1 Tax=Henningerozyma blattae (strain ATCC 34711 / CBS 6284 / DSM 70876 / NBRC 10599 / NRRL Y-10934 / UCD 77-7) TaxID=1071380 RepID=I2H3X9_HENB6|nr:hypothetical protein TBLA_0E00180 [Tetrapisispora blattae CBS 6284]CCH61081.1 hypothetical protein TBLA_0E00180 [Tetrapisispora blattae CBS 6284]